MSNLNYPFSKNSIQRGYFWKHITNVNFEGKKGNVDRYFDETFVKNNRTTDHVIPVINMNLGDTIFIKYTFTTNMLSAYKISLSNDRHIHLAKKYYLENFLCRK